MECMYCLNGQNLIYVYVLTWNVVLFRTQIMDFSILHLENYTSSNFNLKFLFPYFKLANYEHQIFLQNFQIFNSANFRKKENLKILRLWIFHPFILKRRRQTLCPYLEFVKNALTTADNKPFPELILTLYQTFYSTHLNWKACHISSFGRVIYHWKLLSAFVRQTN